MENKTNIGGTAPAGDDDKPAAVIAAETTDAKIAPATTFSTSGAPVQIVPDVDPSHPAVDDNPRAHTSVGDNAITFNDPDKPGAQVVEERLAGMKFEVAAPNEAPKA